MSSRWFEKFICAVLALNSTAFAGDPVAVATRHLERRASAPIAAVQSAGQKETSLPPLPDGVVALSFSSFFKTPIGPRGLEIADELRALNGRRVRVFGYMVREQAADHDEPVASEDASAPAVKDLVPDRFLLTALPQTTNFAHYGLCEDLPPQTVYVTLAKPIGTPVVHTSRPLLLTGVLSVGPQQEPDGRVSIVRLKLDANESSVR